MAPDLSQETKTNVIDGAYRDAVGGPSQVLSSSLKVDVQGQVKAGGETYMHLLKEVWRD